MTSQTIFIKPMTWAGMTEFYVGFQPSRPDADPCSRLGSYFIRTEREFSARCIADSEAARLTKLGRPTTVARCAHYVGYARVAA
jgi:hypothetical protein